MVCALHSIALHTCSHKKGSPVLSFLSSLWPVFRALREIQSCCLDFFSPVEQVTEKKVRECPEVRGERMSWDCLHTGTIMSMVQNFHGHSSQDLVLALALLGGTMKLWDMIHSGHKPTTSLTLSLTHTITSLTTHDNWPACVFHYRWIMSSNAFFLAVQTASFILLDRWLYSGEVYLSNFSFLLWNPICSHRDSQDSVSLAPV